MTKLDVVVQTKDRHSELGLVILGLLHQDFKDWDLYLIDDSDTPVFNCEFLNKLINKTKLEGHKVVVQRAEIRNENCRGRMQGVKLGNSPYILRMDDDTFFLKNDDLKRLVDKMDEGYDMVGAVTPPVGTPEFERENKFARPIIDKIEFDKKGNISMADDCGYSYLEDECLPAHHLRSSFVYKRAIHDAGIEFDTPGRVAFREETKFSLACAWAGFNNFCVITGVKFHHLHTSSGGCRLAPQDYADSCMYGDGYFRDWAKRMFMKHGDPFEK